MSVHTTTGADVSGRPGTEPTPPSQVQAVGPESGPDAAAPSPQRIPALDGLRLLGLLMVMAYDFTAASGRAWGAHVWRVFPGSYLLTSYGFLGVELCLLLSGFAVGLSGWDRRAPGFAIARLTRLLPAYWVAVLTTTVVLVFLPAYEKRPTAPALALNLTMLQEPWGAQPVDPSYWVLWVLLRFYLLYAVFVLIRGCTYRRMVGFLVGWTIASLAADMLPGSNVAAVVDPAYAPYFIAGLAFSLMYRFGPNALHWALVAVSFLLAQQHALDRLGTARHDTGWTHMPWWPVLLFEAAMFAVLAAVALHRFTLPRARFLVVLGAAAYPCYLLHNVIGLTVIARLRHLPPVPLVLVLTVALLLAGLIVHLLGERLFIPLLGRIVTTGLAEARATDASAAQPPPSRPPDAAPPPADGTDG